MATSVQTSQIGAPPIQRGAWLDALRLIVACLMVLHHYQAAGPIALSDYFPAIENQGYLLTNFFLIDSGYVLARIYGAQVAGGRLSLLDFFSKRFFRLVPAHLIMATALVGIVLLADIAGLSPRNPQWFSWAQLPAQFFLVQSLGVPGGLGWNAPTWSISALLGCYLFFPMILKGMRRLSAGQALAVGIALYALANLLTLRFLDLPVYQMPLKYGLLRALPLFMLGVMLARVSDTLFIPARLARVLLGVSAALFFLVQAAGNFGLVSLALISLVILAAAAIPVARPSKLIELGALASFAIFISNEVVRIAYFGVANVLIGKLGLGLGAQWAVWAGGLAGAIAFGFVFYALVDRPLQARVKHLRLPSPVRLARRAAARLPRPRATGFAAVSLRPGSVEVVVDKGRFQTR